MYRLSTLMLSICGRHRRREYSRPEISRALCAIIACFPVYRTYVNARTGRISDDDRRIIRKVVDDARSQASDVDPDNRRPVDSASHRGLLETLDDLKEEEIISHMNINLSKLWVIRRSLMVRREVPGAFGEKGSYEPVAFSGHGENFALGLLRKGEAAAITQRFVLKRGKSWDGTRAGIPEGRWRNVLSGEEIAGPSHLMDDLFKAFPVALLVKEK